MKTEQKRHGGCGHCMCNWGPGSRRAEHGGQHSHKTSGYKVNRDKLGAAFRNGELWRGISGMCSQIGGVGLKTQQLFL